ncbi:hypothetical protein MCOR04_011160, partial [Pyricularia oryzae]
LLARIFQQGDRIKGGLRIITDDDPSGLSDYPFHCVLRFFILKAAAMRAYFRVGEMGLEGVGEVLVLLLGGLQLKAPGLCRLVRGRI